MGEVLIMKWPKLTATVAGAATGFFVGGPIGAPIGAAAGGLVDWLRRPKHKAPPAAAMRVMVPAPGVTPSQLAQASAAASIQIPKEASDLHNFLKGNPLGMIAFRTPTGLALIGAFQRHAMLDANLVSALGPQLPTGTYDKRTSAALTFYTHDPIPPDPVTLIGPPKPSGGGGGLLGMNVNVSAPSVNVPGVGAVQGAVQGAAQGAAQSAAQAVGSAITSGLPGGGGGGGFSF
jgi:hypothetical protein